MNVDLAADAMMFHDAKPSSEGQATSPQSLLSARSTVGPVSGHAAGVDARALSTKILADAAHAPSLQKWVVLIVDDDESIHSITRLILRNATFEGLPVELLSAYTEQDAMQVLQDRDDISMVLLDVVMEHDDTGQRIVTFLRDTLCNKLTRIVLRTGQPAQAPERAVIVDYDINDYRLKTELTADRLYVTVISALRAYRDMHALMSSGHGMERMLEYSTHLLRARYYRDISSGMLRQLAAILHVEMTHARSTGGYVLLCTERMETIEEETGIFEGMRHLSPDALPQHARRISPGSIESILHSGIDHFEDTWFVLSFTSRFGSRMIAVLETGRPLTPLDRTMATLFRNNMTIAYDNITLGGENDRTQREILFTLGEVAEAHSHEVGQHVRRVSEIMHLLAIASGCDEETSDLYRIASTLHDIGKLAIPDAILKKAGKLTDEEMALMKTHTVSGHDMLNHSGSPILSMAALIALQHHERYDGTGYPSGLKGGAIHPAARMASIADVFDALSHQRCYKPAWSIDETVGYLMTQRGSQFDPSLVDLFMSRLDAVRTVHASFPDTEQRAAPGIPADEG